MYTACQSFVGLVEVSDFRNFLVACNFCVACKDCRGYLEVSICMYVGVCVRFFRLGLFQITVARKVEAGHPEYLLF